MAYEVVAERRPVGGGLFYIKYKPGVCGSCNRETYWRSVDGLCSVCAITDAKSKLAAQRSINELFTPWGVLDPYGDGDEAIF